MLVVVDASDHAVVTNAVPGAGGQGVVHGDQGECRDHIAVGHGFLEFRDALFQRAAGHPAVKSVAGPVAGLLILHALRARILALVVAEDAIVGFV
ncbi:MAG: hypothetical protein FD153_384 [Rhodospirillaceae bacterium]|nr:MAG: hypothetical protein FD153_384 [Rhodospirillaceae bacterium]